MIKIKFYQNPDQQRWDAFVRQHPGSMHCHLSGWKHVFEKAYRHDAPYLLAEEEGDIKGILPLCQVKSLFLGNQLVSLPFLNYGGILTSSEEAQKVLVEEAIRLGQKMESSLIELRHMNPLVLQTSNQKETFTEGTHKVRMVLKLPESKEKLLESFKAKLRSQIFRPLREGMQALIGGIEYLNDFYKVFSINMRDLGSPVHSKNFFAEILTEFESDIRVGIVKFNEQPVAAGLIICFKEVVEIPWASSLRDYNRFSPNMLLYWFFLEYACDNGFRYFDFGRSTFGEGTYKFKQQWGAEGLPLHWGYWSPKENGGPSVLSENRKFQLASRLWKKLPLPLTVLLGPYLRRTIPL